MEPTESAPATTPKTRKKWPWIVGGSIALLMLIGALAGDDDSDFSKHVTITGWQNPNGEDALFEVFTYDPEDGSALNDRYDKKAWVVRAHETIYEAEAPKKVGCRGDTVGIMLLSTSTQNDDNGGLAFTAAKCGNQDSCGVVLDLDYEPRLSGCQD